MKISKSWLVSGGALLALCVALPAAAEAEDDRSVNEKILDILLERGDITPERYEELRQEALEEKQAAAQPPAAGEPEGPQWQVSWKNATRIERVDPNDPANTIKLKIGGRIQFDAAASHASNRLDDMFPDAEGTGTDFRRARLFVSGELGEHALFKAEYDFAGTSADFKDVYAGLQNLPWVGTVRAGHFYEPQSLEMSTSSKYITFLERSLPVLAFTAERNSGVGLHNQFFDERMTFHIGGFREVGDDGEEFDDQGVYNAGFRVTGLPLYADEGEKLVHTAFWYSRQFRNNETLSYDPDAESNTVGSLLNMPAIDVDGVDLFGAELAAICGRFYANSEFIASLVNGDRSTGDSDFYGSYVTAGVFLTGERRAYDTGYAIFDRTEVLKPFSLSKGQWGGLELAGRWSYLTLNDGSVRGGILNDFTLGLNWYLYSNLRLMVNYVHAHRNGVGEAHIAQSRVSLEF